MSASRCDWANAKSSVDVGAPAPVDSAGLAVAPPRPVVSTSLRGSSRRARTVFQAPPETDGFTTTSSQGALRKSNFSPRATQIVSTVGTGIFRK